MTPTEIDFEVCLIAGQHVAAKQAVNAPDPGYTHCYEEALRAKQNSLHAQCRFWALRSLSHSIGILHQDYRKVFELSRFEGPVRTLTDIPRDPPARTLRFWSMTRRKHSRNGNPRHTLTVYRLDAVEGLIIVGYELGVSSMSGETSAIRIIQDREPVMRGHVSSSELTLVKLPDVDPKADPFESKARRIR